ncbi:MAG: ADP-ribosylglycohydrolase family protein, partial [Halorhodospira sp.]
MTANAYRRWLQTQRERPEEPMEPGLDGWLFQHPGLHRRRAPGNTCLSALRAMGDSAGPADNDSKGCGGVMRMAPVGLFVWRRHEPHLGRGSVEEAFRLGTELAALTHGHPTGSLAGGALAVLVLALADGASLARLDEKVSGVPKSLLIQARTQRLEPRHRPLL